MNRAEREESIDEVHVPPPDRAAAAPYARPLRFACVVRGTLGCELLRAAGHRITHVHRPPTVPFPSARRPCLSEPAA